MRHLDLRPALLLTAAFLATVLSPTASSAEASPQGYYRFPALHHETLVFCAEGDLWTVGLEGGAARRLTTHAEEETHPVISPDGSQVAFIAAYEGPHEVYVMPLAGGRPVRLTYEGGTNRRSKPKTAGWTKDGQVLYSTRAYSTLPNYQLARIDPRTTATAVLPLAQADDGVYDPSGTTLYFTRLPFQGSYAKRYQGGTAQTLWSFSKSTPRGAPEAQPLTADFPGTSKHPMWWNDRLYFVSDRDGTMNIWSMAVGNDTDLRQHTFHRGWDVQSPSLSASRLVYQLGADLQVFDIAAATGHRLEITLASDFDQTRETWLTKPFDYLTAVHLSPDGDRLVLTARGEIFVAPVGPGRLVHVTRNPGVRYRQGRFLPDGQSLMALSDESGEVEWWRLPANGIGVSQPWTSGGQVLRYDGIPSPDGRWIVSDDHHKQLWLTETKTGQSWKIASSPTFWGIDGVATWSPDSRWFAFSISDSNELGTIYAARVDERRAIPLTTDRYNDFSPAWSPDGEWIYFLSNRHFHSLVGAPWGERQPDPFFDRQTKIYAIALKDSATHFPFEPYNELSPPPPEAPKGDGDGAARKSETRKNETVAVEIDVPNIARRLYEVPVPPGNYSALSINAERLFWIATDTSPERRQALITLEIGGGKSGGQVLADNVLGYELSLDGKKLLLRRESTGQGGTSAESLYVVDAKIDTLAEGPLNLEEREAVDLSGWSFPFDPREEWRQMFVDAWRLHRDYFYDRGMHGIDWPAMREKYLPLVDRVTSRGELSDILGQMISELSALHASVRRGDFRQGQDQIAAAFLGATLQRDESVGGYRITHIYRTDPDLPGRLSPLARPGLGIQEGEILVAVNGVPTLDRPPGATLRNQAGKQTRLAIQSEGETRDVIVVPIDAVQARGLRYDEWEYTRRLRVDEASVDEASVDEASVDEDGDPRIGYVHLRAMGTDNIAEWQREFYPVFQRQGLIVDVRHNPGGNIDSWVLGKLLRQAWMYWQAPSGEPYWNMQKAFRGHMVVLVNERTGSDGEAFAEGFRRLGLGPVIGTRTWGGEIWLTGSNVLVDKGIATAAEFGVYGPEGVWLIEGHGVDPDIVVDNLPHVTFNGEDAQLDTAIEHLLEKIRQDPRPVPLAPEYPNMSER